MWYNVFYKQKYIEITTTGNYSCNDLKLFMQRANAIYLDLKLFVTIYGYLWHNFSSPAMQVILRLKIWSLLSRSEDIYHDLESIMKCRRKNQANASL